MWDRFFAPGLAESLSGGHAQIAVASLEQESHGGNGLSAANIGEAAHGIFHHERISIVDQLRERWKGCFPGATEFGDSILAFGACSAREDLSKRALLFNRGWNQNRPSRLFQISRQALVAGALS